MKEPRGIRNCNPLNIERNNIRWQGMMPNSGDKRFCRFIQPRYGWRAAFIILMKAYKERGWDTVEKVIEHWAPSCENDTEAYIQVVCRRTYFSRTKHLEGEDYKRLAIAMAYHENGKYYADEIDQGYQMAQELLK